MCKKDHPVTKEYLKLKSRRLQFLGFLDLLKKSEISSESCKIMTADVSWVIYKGVLS